MAMRLSRGFTLIELMIVVSIIAIIVAIALPNMIRARVISNEASAINNIRAFISAEAAFYGSANKYTGTITDLTGASPPFLNGTWAGIKSGFTYALGGTDMNYTVIATPAVFGQTGNRGFFCDGSGVIREEFGAVATVASTPITQHN